MGRIIHTVGTVKKLKCFSKKKKLHKNILLVCVCVCIDWTYHTGWSVFNKQVGRVKTAFKIPVQNT